MCNVCAAFQPHTVKAGECEYEGLNESDETGSGQNPNLGNSMSSSGGLPRDQKMADYLNISEHLISGYFEDRGAGARDWSTDADGNLTVNLTGLTAQGKHYAEAAMEVWADVTGLEFTVTTSTTAQITFDDEDTGGYARSWTQGDQLTKVDINIQKSFLTDHNAQFADYAFFVYVHELGHALGLGHAGNYNFNGGYADRVYDNDSMQGSAMSYVWDYENPNIDASFGYIFSAQVADIYAIQQMYGLETDTRSTDTVYGVGTNVSETYLQDLDTSLETGGMTLYDDGGTDTLDLSSTSYGQHIDLAPGAISDAVGKKGNLVIDWGTTIENATSGSGWDYLSGNDADNILDAGAGDDVLWGGAGDDTLIGGDGTDEARFDDGRQEYTVQTGQSGQLIITHDVTGERDVVQDVEMFRFGTRTYTREELDAEDTGEVFIDKSERYVLIDDGARVFELTDDRGRAVFSSSLRDWDAKAGSFVGEDIGLVFYNADDDVWREWILDGAGNFLSLQDSAGPHTLARLEAIYGDLDGDGSVAEMPDRAALYVLDRALMIGTADGDVSVLSERGAAVRETVLRTKETIGAAEVDGGFVLAFRDTRTGEFEVWQLDDDGKVILEAELVGEMAQARAETLFGDLDGDGAIDQAPANPELVVVDRYLMLSTEDGYTSLKDTRDRDLRETELRDWTVLSAVEAGDGHRVVMQNEEGEYREWSVSAEGVITDESLSIGQLALSRLEAVHGDLDGDGQLAQAPENPELVVLAGYMMLSTEIGDIALLDGGRPLRKTSLRDWEPAGAVVDGAGFKAVLQSEAGVFREWGIAADGLITELGLSTGVHALARIEQIYGDVDGNNSIAQHPDHPEIVTLERTLWLNSEAASLQLTDERGRPLRDSELRDLEVAGVRETDMGYHVVLKEDDGALHEWTLDPAGSRLTELPTTGPVSLARLEAIYGDLDGDGQVAEMPAAPQVLPLDRELVLTAADGDVWLLDDRGRPLRDSLLRDWDVAGVKAESDGYHVVLTNEDGLFQEWHAATDGMIGTPHITTGSVALARLEAIFGDLDGDGSVASAPEDPEVVVINRMLVLTTMEGDVSLYDERGRALSETTALRGWEVIGTAETDGGYAVVLRDEDDHLKLWSLSQEGAIVETEVTKGDMALARLERAVGDLDSSGDVNDLPADPDLLAVEKVLTLVTAIGDLTVLDTNGRPMRDTALRDWDVVGVKESDLGFRAGFRDEDGDLLEWTLSSTGQITSTERSSGEVALARFEAIYGDIDGDGGVETMPTLPEVVAVERALYISTEDGNVAMLDVRGNAMRDSVLSQFRVVAVDATEEGYLVAVQGVRDGILRAWSFDEAGALVGDTGLIGATMIARIEQVLGDIDGDGDVSAIPDDPALVVVDKGVRVVTAEGDLTLVDSNGRNLRDTALRDWTPLDGVEDGDGFRVVMQNENGLFREWTIDSSGAITEDVYSTGAVSLARLEAVYGDLDASGVLNTMPDSPEVVTLERTLWLSTPDGDIALSDTAGRAMRDSALNLFNVLGAEADGDTFVVLVEGKRDEALRTWTFDANGALTNDTGVVGHTLLARVEALFGDVDGDGQVAEMPEDPELVIVDKGIRIVTETSDLVLVDARGRDLRDTALRGWEPEGGVEDGTGFKAVMSNGAGLFREWSVSAEGLVTDDQLSTGPVALARLEAVYGDLDGDGSVAEMPDSPDLVSLDRTLWVSTADGNIALHDAQGRTMRDTLLNTFNVVDVEETSDGFLVVVQGARDGALRSWSFDNQGGLIDDVGVVGPMMIARLEAVFGDVDGDGQVTSIPDRPELVIVDRGIRIVNEEGDLVLVDTRGNELRDMVLRGWEPVAAAEADSGDGFTAVMYDGNDNYREWTIDTEGLVTLDQESSGSVALARLEAIYGDVDGDGHVLLAPTSSEVVALDRKLYLSTPEGFSELRTDAGRAISEVELRSLTVESIEDDAGALRIWLEHADGTEVEWHFNAELERVAVVDVPNAPIAVEDAAVSIVVPATPVLNEEADRFIFDKSGRLDDRYDLEYEPSTPNDEALSARSDVAAAAPRVEVEPVDDLLRDIDDLPLF